MKRYALTLAVLAAGLLLTPAVGFADGTRDQEILIDVAGLAETMQRATEPVATRMRDSNLRERFEAVNAILEQDESS